MFRSFLILILFVLAAMAANPVMSGSTSVPAPEPPPQRDVVEECTENWNSSSASNTCSNASIVEVLNRRCRITADCQNNSGGSGSTWKTMEPNQANQLVNCNGTLKLNNC